MYCPTYCMDHAHNCLDIQNEILVLALPRKSKVGKIPFLFTLIVNSHLLIVDSEVNSHIYLHTILKMRRVIQYFWLGKTEKE